MEKEVRVVVVEDDPFARNWMVLVTARDWRTRVVGEANHPLELIPMLKDEVFGVDFVIMDTDIPDGEDWIPRVLEAIAPFKKQPMILCTGIRPNPRVLSQLTHPAFQGYILKDEIRYSLAWAISKAINRKWVITDGIQALAASIGFEIPKPCVVLDGRNVIGYLSERQADVARLAFLFSMERGELADELGVGEDWGFQLVSATYKSLGLEDVLTDDTLMMDYFGEHDLILDQVERIRSERKGSKKSKGMETLAFHMMTMPEIKELD
ncbi:MAG: hypothetical protein AB1894_22300 [Chloroflexota bacterium]